MEMLTESQKYDQIKKIEIANVFSGIAFGFAAIGTLLTFTKEEDKKHIAPALLIGSVILVIGVQVYKHKK